MKAKSAATLLSRIFFIFGLGGILFIISGFFKFADSVLNMPNLENIPAKDGIVVLTGGSAERLKTGVNLLKNHKGKRLLISGVYLYAAPDEVRAIAGGSRELYDCCIDLGKEATDTITNGQEVHDWLLKNSYKSMILVTDNYHMPRSILEIRNANRGIDIVPIPVASPPFTNKKWWQDEKTAKGLMLEYGKYQAARLRLFFGIDPENLNGQNSKNKEKQ